MSSSSLCVKLTPQHKRLLTLYCAFYGLTQAKGIMKLLDSINSMERDLSFYRFVTTDKMYMEMLNEEKENPAI